MRLQSPHLALTNLLGADGEQTVVVSISNWTEDRMMQSEDGRIVFQQRREADGEWLLTDFLEPDGADDWKWTERNAARMHMPTPEVEWCGPLESIPTYLLMGDEPLWVRRVDRIGWVDLRKIVKERSEAQA